MTRRFGAMLAALSLTTLVAACGPSTAEQCAEAKNPSECVQVANAGGDVSDYLLYGMAGYMLSSAINGAGQRQQVIVADPSYHGPRRSIASYQSSPERARRTTTTTVHRKDGSRVTRTTTSWSSRPSYRSSGFRSSGFRSSRR